MSRFLICAFFIHISMIAYADQILVLSGGGSPENNHYSQYLQTKTLYSDLKERFSDLSPSLFFGAGNRTGTAATIGDVHRVYKEDDLLFSEMIPGFIPDNNAATPKNINQYFDRLLIAPNETFFMLVSDHGSPFINSRGEIDESFSNNCIELWGTSIDLKADTYKENPPYLRCLSKNSLQTKLRKAAAKGRVVFAMSQCFSGGFHQMSVDTNHKYPSANPAICGFTSVTEDDTAAGCTPSVNDVNHQGYERAFTEQLTGLDVVSAQKLRPGRTSLKEAHEEATVQDLTKDIPLSTSDYYLWQWALAIEASNFKPRTKKISAKEARSYIQNSQIGQTGDSESTRYQGKNLFFSRAQAALNFYPEYRDLLKAPLSAHQALEDKLAAQLEDLADRIEPLALALNTSVSALSTQWKQFVSRSESVPNISPLEAQLERQIGFSPILVMSFKAVSDLKTANALRDYNARRMGYALEWAARSPEKDLRNLAQAINELESSVKNLEDEYLKLEIRHGHVRRLLIYRQILGALNALEKMEDPIALKELDGLLSCENARLSSR